jgi:hypothetical protein
MTMKRGELESAICEDFYLGLCGMYLYASVDHGGGKSESIFVRLSLAKRKILVADRGENRVLNFR